MEWIELSLPVGDLAWEVAALLVETEPAAGAGAEVRDGAVVVWVPAAEGEAGLADLRRAAARLRAHGFAVDPDAVAARPAAPEDEWRDAWKRHFHARRVGQRLVIVPSWESFAPQPGDLVLHLDPGRAFGTGAHASTRLALAELEELGPAGVHRFLDVGTGSGILALAAAKLWPPATGIALDVDASAVAAAAENLERNGVLARVDVSDRPLAAVEGTFDLILANIQADVLEGMRDALAARLAPGGVIVLSGLLSDQAAPVAEGYRRAGLTLLRIRRFDDEPDWSSVTLVRE